MSISTVKRVSSSTGSTAKTSPSQTLINVGATGSSDQLPATTGSGLSLTDLKAVVAKSQKLSLLSKLDEISYELLRLPAHVDAAWTSAVEQELNALMQADNWQPLGLRGAAVYIDQLASVFQVDVPDEAGLQVYLSLLEGKPTGPAMRAVKEIVLSHRYKTLPLPAVIVSAIDDDPVYRRLMNLHYALRRIKTKQ